VLDLVDVLQELDQTRLDLHSDRTPQCRPAGSQEEALVHLISIVQLTPRLHMLCDQSRSGHK
jgi:hypothetical protein